MMPIHASAAILGQQSGMEIEHAPMVGLDQKLGNHEQKTGQDDEVDAVLAHQGKEQVFAVEVGFTHHHGGDVVVLGSHQCVGIRPIAQHQGYFYPCMVMEMADDVLAVSSVARNKNGYSYHAVYLFFFFSAGRRTRPVPFVRCVSSMFLKVVFLLFVVKAKHHGVRKGVERTPFFLGGSACSVRPVDESADTAHLQEFVLLRVGHVLVDLG